MGVDGLLFALYILSLDLVICLRHTEIVCGNFGRANTIQQVFPFWNTLSLFNIVFTHAVHGLVASMVKVIELLHPCPYSRSRESLVIVFQPIAEHYSALVFRECLKCLL